MELRMDIGCTSGGTRCMRPYHVSTTSSARLCRPGVSASSRPSFGSHTSARSVWSWARCGGLTTCSAQGAAGGHSSGADHYPSTASANSSDSLPLVMPEVLDEHGNAAPEEVEAKPNWRQAGKGGRRQQTQAHSSQPPQSQQQQEQEQEQHEDRQPVSNTLLPAAPKRVELSERRVGPRGNQDVGSRPASESGADPQDGAAPSGRPASWAALVALPALMWAIAWLLTAGLASASYAALAAAANITAAAFCGLAPAPAAASATAEALSTSAAAATAAAVAAVDWIDVALRTAAGLAGDVSGRNQVVLTLQEAGASPAASWAVLALLPGLCAAAAALRGAALAVQSGLPGLGTLVQLSTVAVGTGFLLVLVLPLRPYVAPLLPLLPKARPSASILAALRAGGIACMVAVLTGLQASEVVAPSLGPSVRGAMAAAASSSPLLLQHQALSYAAAVMASDVVLAACTALVAAGLLAGRRGRWAVRALAAGRLLVDVVLLLAVAAGHLSGKISAVRLLGMLWLFQTALQT